MSGYHTTSVYNKAHAPNISIAAPAQKYSAVVLV